MGLVLILVAAVVMLVGGIWCLVEAFKTSILWGLGYLFVPFVSLIWVVMHWDRAKKPFLITMAGIPVYVVGFMMLPEVTMATGG